MTTRVWMRRALGIVLVTLFLSATSHAVEAPVRILPLGDSLTEGVTFPVVEGGYRNRLYSLLDTAGYTVDFVGTKSDVNNPTLPDREHDGWSGYRIDQIQSAIGGWLDAVEDPDVVLLLIGTNDIWQNYQITTIETRLANLIADISMRRPFAKVIVSNLPRRTDSSGFEAQQAAFNTNIPGIVADQVALGRPVTFVDMHSVLTPADYSSDGVHPSTAGYEKMADTWFSAITSVITPAGTANPPLIARIDPPVDATHVSVVFSKPVADDAANVANFGLSGNLAVSNAVLDPLAKRAVTLTTSPQTPGVVYTLTVSGVRDRTAEQTLIAPESKANFGADDPNLIVNGGFENDYAGWTQTGNQEIKTTPEYVPSEGTKLVAFNTDQTTPNGTLSQSFATTPDQTYQLTFDMGVYSYNTQQQKLRVSVQGNNNRLQMDTTMNGINNGDTVWQPRSYLFTANSPISTLTFADISTTSNSLDLLLDKVRLTGGPTHTLAVASSPVSGVTMTVGSNDINGDGNGSTGLIRIYNEGTGVTVTAPASAGGRDFLNWRVNGTDFPGSDPAITVTLDTNTTLTAIYDPASDPVAPVAVEDDYTTDEDTPLVIAAAGVLGNDSDGNPYPLTAVENAAPSHGNLTLNSDGGFNYTPAPDYHGPDSFTYHANNGYLDSNVVTVSLTVAPVNDAPVADAQYVTTDEDTALPVTLTGSDPDGDAITGYTVTVGPQHGTLGGTAPNLTYTPNVNFNGTDSFSFTVNDGALDSLEPALVSITVSSLAEFDQWLGGFALSGSPGDDPDGDAIVNAIEYVIAGNPGNTPDSGHLPTLALVHEDPDGDLASSDYLRFTYRRADLANADPDTAIAVEWTTDPTGSWTEADGTPGVVTLADDDLGGTGVDLVRVYLPTTLSSGEKLFARLRVSVFSP